MSETDLLAEGTQLRSDGHHATQSRRDFDEVAVRVVNERGLDLEIVRPAQDTADRLASMCAVRRETWVAVTVVNALTVLLGAAITYSLYAE